MDLRAAGSNPVTHPLDSRPSGALARGAAPPRGRESRALSERSEPKGYSVYIAQLTDGRLYVGYTSHLARRVAEHVRGAPDTWTTHINPLRRILYTEFHADKGEANRRERQLKGWSRAKKLALAEGRMDDLKRLARRRNA